jgi:rhamnulose-1-phosphate aldolase/alcohol dehydrogenase
MSAEERRQGLTMTGMPLLEALPFEIPANRWSEAEASGLSPAELLLYRSNLLGSDLTVTNFGGGNTSAKLSEQDPLTGESVDVLWVKGSGGDLGSMQLDGFSTLYQDRLLALEKKYPGPGQEDAMVGLYPHCTFNLNPRAPSIDTPLHAWLPFTHVDHVHPDALIALAASSAGASVTREIFGGEVGWLPWKRPGFELALWLRDLVDKDPKLRGVMLANHGVICWGDSARSCYDNTIDLIATAAGYLNSKLASRTAFGGSIAATLALDERRSAVSSLMPRLRGLVNGGRSKVGHFADGPEILQFTGSADFERLAAVGTSCPDHFLRTKIAPLTLDPDRIGDDDYLQQAVTAYRDDYAGYYRRCADADDPPMRDPGPVVILVPGIGQITFAGDKKTARLASEYYANAINVMRGAEAIGDYIGLDEREAFNIEYWALEEAKLQRMPKPKALAGKVALITGAAGGIGAACAKRLMADGACVMLTDRDSDALAAAHQAATEQSGMDPVRSVICDVTDERQVEAAFAACAVEFGGVDILVANAGLASSAPIESTTLELWRRNYDVLADGCFLTSRAAFAQMKRQGGGSIVFIGSKNAVAATKNASAYASSKAAAVHLARCLALEGADHGIRVNVVNPDAVIRGSRIWDGDWRKERAEAYGVDAGEELEEYYRQRSLLKLPVLPEDIAEAVCFFASPASSKSTGNMLNVDAGNAQAFTR